MLKTLSKEAIVGLCLVGMVLVIFSEALGVQLAARPFAVGNGWTANNDDAHHVAETIRWLGGMLLAIGLVERVVCAIRSTSGDYTKLP